MLKKGLLILTFLLFSCVGLVYFYTHHQWWTRSVLSATAKPDYTFVFVGDSLTEYLGNFEDLNESLSFYFPKKNFLLLNYGYSSTNLLSLPERIEKDSTHSGRIFQAINDIPFDYIFIESMGQNPLSEYPLQQGLEMQTKTLDKVIELLTNKHPRASIIFVATIAPTKEHFGIGAVELSKEKRVEWANERIEYMKNHIKYAKEHKIPLINIYEKSLDSFGNGNILFISRVDHIHPSPAGVRFISRQIAQYIYENKLVR